MGHNHRHQNARSLDALLGVPEGSQANPGTIHFIKTLSNTVHDALVITDHKFIILLTNNTLHQRFGYGPTELDGKHLSSLFNESHWAQLESTCIAFSSLSKPPREISQVIDVTDKQRHESSMAVHLQCLRVADKDFFFIRFRGPICQPDDWQISTKKRQQLLRLQAVGRLTAGLAHEYNNLLTSIVGYSDILKMRLSQHESFSRYIDHISHASNRAADLTRHVMAFSRQHSNQPELTDLNAIISDMEKMIRGLFEDDIDLTFQFTPNPTIVWIDLGAFLQILIILLLSVREALNRGSQVNIATQNQRLPFDFTPNSRDDRDGGFINLVISYRINPATVRVDKSDIIPIELQDLPDDFAEVIDLIRDAGGQLIIVSETSYCKTYHISLPIDPHRPHLRAEKIEDIPLASSPDCKTILVVDDEDLIRALVREALQMEGYQVLEASHPSEAMNISREFKATIDLLVSDVVMPGMNGRELADHLVAERPHLKLLFISGHSPTILTRTGVETVQGRFLQKPFSTSELVKSVRSALAHP